MNNATTKIRAIRIAVSTGGISCVAVIAVWYFATTNILVLVLGLCLSLVIGLMCYALTAPRHDLSTLDIFETLFELAHDSDISLVNKQISKSLLNASQRKDSIFRELLMQRLDLIAEDIKMAGDGRIEFISTESWRIFYEQILKSPGINNYRSVSHIETQNYWQDGAGRKSTELNLKLHDSGTVRVERIAIVADHLWQNDELFPVGIVHEWLEEQHRHGIWIELVRESDLAREPELISDFGIYGNRAVGRQFSDSGGRTSRFVLSFDFDDVKKAEDYWKKLRVFTVSYAKLLDQQH